MSEPVSVGKARRRPILFFLVYGVFLVLIGITATTQAIMVSAHFSASVLSAVVAADRTIVSQFISTNLSAEDLGGAPTHYRRVVLGHDLQDLVATAGFQGSEVLLIEVRDADGSVRFATTGAAISPAAVNASFMRAADGDATIDIVGASDASLPVALPDGATHLIVENLPVVADGKTQAVVTVTRDGTPITARLDQTRRDIVLLTIAAALIVSLVLFLIFRAAQQRISRQTLQLIEAARQDSLTGLLNHGSVVEELAGALDVARVASRSMSVALVDIDNFGLLNQTHGHQAGDAVLQSLAATLSDFAPPPYTLGRYGPDEFLVVAPIVVGRQLERLVHRLRERLAESTVQFGRSERLPITISVGLATFPDHAASVTDLLSTVTTALLEAKSGGGDSVRVANRTSDERADARGFDVLQGLVIAVDTKDHYTRRHSEDVSRYATFLGRRLGLDEEFQSTLRLAGLLHDVGKIGIPDHVLRKPGRLNDDETEIVKQHVALGDAIVRDLPNIEAIRAGIRHHHERWDGGGYLHALAARDIPLIARILSVADVFSAMTTTRPYRKALDLREALKRLGEAAGTQLDEELVKVFISGLETSADAPLPGQDHPAGSIWVPPATRSRARVAAQQ